MPDSEPGTIRNLEQLRAMVDDIDFNPSQRQAMDQMVGTMKSYFAEWGIDPNDEDTLNAIAAGVGFVLTMEQVRANNRSPEDDMLDMVATALGVALPPRDFADLFDTAGSMSMFMLSQTMQTEELPNVTD